MKNKSLFRLILIGIFLIVVSSYLTSLWMTPVLQPPIPDYKGPIWIVHLRPWAEVAYFISSVLLLAVTIYGANQITLLKHDIKSRNLRASKEATAEYCSKFAEYVLKRRIFIKECAEKGLPLYDGKINKDFTIDSLSEDFVNAVEEKMKLDSGASALNDLELIAFVFLSGLADDADGFKTIGRAFCGTVATHYDIFAVRAKRHGFQNVRQLYAHWSDQMSAEDLQREIKSLEAKLPVTCGPNKPIGL